MRPPPTDVFRLLRSNMSNEIVCRTDTVIDISHNTVAQSGYSAGANSFKICVEQPHMPTRTCRIVLMKDGQITDASPAHVANVILSITSPGSQASVQVQSERMTIGDISVVGYRCFFLISFLTSAITSAEIINAHTAFGLKQQITLTDIDMVTASGMGAKVSLQLQVPLTEEQTVALDLYTSSVQEGACLLAWANGTELRLHSDGTLVLYKDQALHHSFTHTTLLGRTARIVLSSSSELSTLFIDEIAEGSCTGINMQSLMAIGRTAQLYSHALAPSINGTVRNIYIYNTSISSSMIETSMTGASGCVFAWTTTSADPEIKQNTMRVPRVGRVPADKWTPVPLSLTPPSVTGVITIGAPWVVTWTSMRNVGAYVFTATHAANSLSETVSCTIADDKLSVSVSLPINTYADHTVTLLAERFHVTSVLSVLMRSASSLAQFPGEITTFTTSQSHALPHIDGYDIRAVIDFPVTQAFKFDLTLDNITVQEIRANGIPVFVHGMPGASVQADTVSFPFVARGTPPFAFSVLLKGQDGYEQLYAAPATILAAETLAFPTVLQTTRDPQSATIGTNLTLTTYFNMSLMHTDASDMAVASSNDAQSVIPIIDTTTMQYNVIVNEDANYAGTYTFSYGNVQKSYKWVSIPLTTGAVYTLPTRFSTSAAAAPGVPTDIVLTLESSETLPANVTLVMEIRQGGYPTISPSHEVAGNNVTLKNVILSTTQDVYIDMQIIAGAIVHHMESIAL